MRREDREDRAMQRGELIIFFEQDKHFFSVIFFIRKNKVIIYSEKAISNSFYLQPAVRPVQI